jgi:hypothetical protein
MATWKIAPCQLSAITCSIYSQGPPDVTLSLTNLYYGNKFYKKSGQKCKPKRLKNRVVPVFRHHATRKWIHYSLRLKHWYYVEMSSQLQVPAVLSLMNKPYIRSGRQRKRPRYFEHAVQDNNFSVDQNQTALGQPRTKSLYLLSYLHTSNVFPKFYIMYKH